MKKFLIVLFLLLNTSHAKPSLDEMIGQMIMVGFGGVKPTDKWVEQIGYDIERGNVGGVLLLKRNINSPKQLKELTSYLQSKSKKSPLLISVDQEGGKVTRLSQKNGFYDVPSAKTVATTKTIKEAEEIYEKVAKTLSDHGINYNLAPVVDIFKKDSPAIGKRERSFSTYSNIVSVYASTFTDAFSKYGVLTSLKHFPGHGSAVHDSHLQRTDISNKWSFDELRPYFDLIKMQKAPSIMVGHLYLNKFDEEYPSSLSKTMITSLLREQLGFKGVVISDDFLMKGVSKKYTLETIVEKSINAGVDILLFSAYFMNGTNTPKALKKAIKEAIKTKKIKQETIEAAYERIVEMKKGLR